VTTHLALIGGVLQSVPVLDRVALQRPHDFTPRITQVFGQRSVTGVIHRGVDYAVYKVMTYTPGTGRVAYIRHHSFNMDYGEGGYGRFVDVDLLDIPQGVGITRVMCRVGHLDSIRPGLEVGDILSAGDLIGAAHEGNAHPGDGEEGISGDSGLAFGAHSHFEVRIFGSYAGYALDWNGSAIDPSPYVGRRGPVELSEQEIQIFREEVVPVVYNLKVVGTAAKMAGLTSKQDSAATDEEEDAAKRRVSEFFKDAQRPINDIPAGPRRDLMRAYLTTTPGVDG
jgi:hypothetical protein